jgi:hypothetical protein
MVLATWVLVLAQAAGSPAADDPNAAPRPPLSFRVFQNMDKPITGRWVLEIPSGQPRRIELKELVAGQPRALVGLDLETREEVLRLDRKEEGIGYAGELKKVFGPCGLEAVAVREFVGLGDTIHMRFETTPPLTSCPPIDSGQAGKLEGFTPGGGTIRLRDLSDISSPTTRDEYSIGGDRATTETLTYRLDAVSIDAGTELKMRQRMKAPLDGSIWFEVEPVIAPEAGVNPPRGFLKASNLRFIGSLTLQRLPG